MLEETGGKWGPRGLYTYFICVALYETKNLSFALSKKVFLFWLLLENYLCFVRLPLINKRCLSPRLFLDPI
jgi:hypothetical protein